MPQMNKTVWMTEKRNLWCTLNASVITEDGDFIPKGTPVSVIGWDQEKDNNILVRTTVYMYADDMGEDENGNPLSGVSVIIAGQKGGTSTDISGGFSIAASENSVLSFSFVITCTRLE